MNVDQHVVARVNEDAKMAGPIEWAVEQHQEALQYDTRAKYEMYLQSKI